MPSSFPIHEAQESIQAIINEGSRQTLKPPNAWSRKAENLILALEEDVQHASDALSFGNTIPEPATLRPLLDNAAKVVKSAGRSISQVKYGDPIVQEHKDKVIGMLRNLDARISHLGGLLPPCPPETTPIPVDAGKLFHFRIHYL